ncbi:tRNA epoxyqueuosine(34) reductase QueG [Thiocapsa imhoffii]|uniref:Epoxyqueuosine reductase n=1 Tax=Thiocapsa imhoffii TaxID=382777 RepID=A0A9X0WIG9_9GAMM|nr:tRNA epoxyqueuosine(34) reductase QueG [Thiocapsa imhoffii]MBK1645329.1 tRNA epoxyqueuosine(34) reductase QueG [Thiocapsa imhoffii]
MNPNSGHAETRHSNLADPHQDAANARLAADIKAWGRALGFQQVGIADTDLTEAEGHLHAWLEQGRHGAMTYMARHGTMRSRPAQLLPGTRSVISVRLDYLPQSQQGIATCLEDPARAFISRYALGRDYHKVLRNRLRRLAERIRTAIGPFGHRVCVDSAPVMEKPLAAKAGLGWIGKHTNLLHPRAGSWFFLGELYTDLALPPDRPIANHCGRCTACIAICPTRAIVAPYELDARRCIAYLTIEHPGPIPEAFRRAIGNRVYGCDDCQLVCPWNRFARLSVEDDFQARYGLDQATLIDLFSWDEPTFLARTQGSAIRRIGHLRWLRNLSIALGNAPASPGITSALAARAHHPDELIREHVGWALREQASRRG